MAYRLGSIRFYLLSLGVVEILRLHRQKSPTGPFLVAFVRFGALPSASQEVISAGFAGDRPGGSIPIGRSAATRLRSTGSFPESRCGATTGKSLCVMWSAA